MSEPAPAGIESLVVLETMLGRASSTMSGGAISILSDFYIATEAEARAVGADSTPAAIFTSGEWNGLTTLEMAELGEVLLERPYLDILDSMRKDPAGSEEEGEGPWINPLPEDLVKSLASLSPAAIAIAASSWAAYMDGWAAQDAKEVIEDLARLSRLALGQRRRLWLWTCL